MGHDDSDLNGRKYAGPEHAGCNRGAGAVKGNSRRRAWPPAQPRQPKVPPDDPARGVFYGPDGQRWSRAWLPWRDPEEMERLRLEIESRRRGA